MTFPSSNNFLKNIVRGFAISSPTSSSFKENVETNEQGPGLFVIKAFLIAPKQHLLLCL